MHKQQRTDRHGGYLWQRLRLRQAPEEEEEWISYACVNYVPVKLFPEAYEAYATKTFFGWVRSKIIVGQLTTLPKHHT